MKVLVTGGAGFIGSYLVEFLLKRGDEVRVIDNLSTGREENLQFCLENPRFKFVFGSVSDEKLMDEQIGWCNHCYHLAAPVGVKYIMDNPVASILDNIRGIDVVLNTVKKHDKRVLVASTSEVYGKSLDLLDPTGEKKLKEDDYRIEGSSQNHRWAYANTKSLDEFLSFAFFKEYGTEVVIVRLFNTVGPRQLSNYGMVIPNFVERALKGEPLKVFGTGEQKRSFMHVSDVLNAITGLMGAESATGRAFNVGSPVEITILDLAKKVVELTKSNSEIKIIPYEDYYGKGFEDMNRRTADISRLKETIGFKVNYQLDDILKDVIAYKSEKVKINHD